MPDLPDTPTPAERDLGEIVTALLAILDDVPPWAVLRRAELETLRARHDALRCLLEG